MIETVTCDKETVMFYLDSIKVACNIFFTLPLLDNKPSHAKWSSDVDRNPGRITATQNKNQNRNGQPKYIYSDQ